MNFELINVKAVYNAIADDFNRTRYAYWENVHKFILSLEPNTTFLDLGCGNGKYLSIRQDLDLYAIDNCENLIKIVNNKYPTVNTCISDVTCIAYENNFFDTVISIAVIHHLSTKTRRLEMINEIIRVLKVGGKALITGWATVHTHRNTLHKATKISDLNDYLIPWEDKKNKTISQRYYHLFELGELEKLINNFSNVKILLSSFEKDNWNVIFEKINI